MIAARIGDVSTTELWEQAVRFFTFSDSALRYALAGSVLLGISCGILGSFIVVRRMALVGDTLSHAVLPGVAIGFLWNMSKDPVAIFVGASVAGLLGTTTVTWITRTTRIKMDAALGLVLASFFAVGSVMMTRIQRLETGAKSGIDKYLFGQAAALGADDVLLIGIITVLTVVVIGLLYRPLLAASFDPGFSRSVGLPVRALDHVLMTLLAFAVVVALQAVGVVLVSAMLITPAAAAYLLTDRLHRMVWMASGFGMVAGAAGCFFSFLGNNLPTGPFMVLAASAVFVVAFAFAPRHGLAARWWRHLRRDQKIGRENSLKAIYRILEDRAAGFDAQGVTVADLAAQRHEPESEAAARARSLVATGLATWSGAPGTSVLHLTPAGQSRAREIVRNHRLWELYLTNAMDYPADHVHDDADKIEHVLGEQTVKDLAKRLDFPAADPHGRPIPD
ncbi:metal ABC transporter permease [soil metagenome]